MTAEQDAAARREAWLAAGAPDYNAPIYGGGGDITGYQSVTAPTAPSGGGGALFSAGGLIAPQAPTAPMGTDGVTWQTVSPEIRAMFEGTYPGQGQQMWEQQHAQEIGAFGQAPQAPAGQAPTPQGQPQQAEQQQAGTNYDWAQDYYTKIAEANQKAMQFSQGIEQGKLDLQKAISESDKAYRQAMMQFQNQQLAQQAAQHAMEVELRRQTIQLQRQQMLYDRRRQGGNAFSRARVRIV